MCTLLNCDKNLLYFRGVPNGLFVETWFPAVKLDKESEILFFISQNKCRASWFTACMFRETVTTFGLCSVTVSTLTEHTMILSCDCLTPLDTSSIVL